MFRVSTGLINRYLIKPSVIQCMGKKKKNFLKPLEGDEARYINKSVIAGVNEPEYLSLLKPPIPFYNLINFQFFSPDYVSLEGYTRYVQKFLRGLGFNICDYWAVPHKSYQYQIMKNEENVVDSTFDFAAYQRVIQLKDIRAVSLPVIIQLLEASKPPGLTISIKEHTDEDEKVRYVINTALLELKQELDVIYTELEELGAVGVRKPDLLQ